MSKHCPQCGQDYIAESCEYCFKCGYKFADNDDMLNRIRDMFGLNKDKTT